MTSYAASQPLVSVVILNYNGRPWLERCLQSLRQQTIFDRTQVIIADNASADGSDQLAETLLHDFPNSRFLQNGLNLGFCEGNNRGASLASGRYLFFLNNDTWLEPDCLENLCRAMEETQAGAGGAHVLDYDNDRFQSIGGTGFDWLGFPDAAKPLTQTRDLFATCGCAYVIRSDVFTQVGGFDAEFFLYSDETDLSWRVWIAGYRVAGIPSARVHHRGAVAVNPQGGTRMVESRTSADKRYYANRNGLLFILKNARHILLLMILPHLAYLALEASASLVLLRSWPFVRRAYLAAVWGTWCLRGHIWKKRREINQFRRRGDFWMLRFLRLKPSRWEEVERLFRVGVPRVD
jgi:GT2 family glycosyltransferase